LVLPLFIFISNLSTPVANPVKNAAVSSSTKTTNSVPAPTKISLNTADAEMLAAHLIGVGLKKAQAIVEYRQKYGPFTAASQLAEVPGFGEVLVKQNLARLKL
jgi:competence protein ComEA